MVVFPVPGAEKEIIRIYDQSNISTECRTISSKSNTMVGRTYSRPCIRVSLRVSADRIAVYCGSLY